MTTLITIEFIKDRNNCNGIASVDRDFPTYVWGGPTSSKPRLVRSLKRQMNSFYPGHNFIFNFVDKRECRQGRCTANTPQHVAYCIHNKK